MTSTIDRIEFYCERHRKPHRVVAYTRTPTGGHGIHIDPEMLRPWYSDPMFAPAKARARAAVEAAVPHPMPAGLTASERARFKVLHNVLPPETPFHELVPVLDEHGILVGTRRVFLNLCDRCGFGVERREERMFP
ncbi:MAG: hypothetical protein WAX29_05105, partial [Propionibacterium sp.]